MTNFLCTPPCSRTTLIVAKEAMHFFIVQKSLSLRTKILCISGVPMNDLAPMKNVVLGVQAPGLFDFLLECVKQTGAFLWVTLCLAPLR